MLGYNVKILHYPTEKSIRLYTKEIFSNETKKDNKKSKNYKPNIKNNDDNTRSQEVSKNRTINKIYELSRANMWQYFITLTFDPKKIDRYDYDKVSNALIKWVHNMKQNYAKDLKYILVPELHKDGAYHFHGLIANTGNIQFVDSGKRSRTHDIIYNIGNYDLGFTTATKIKDTNKASSYLTKYITKELCATTTGKKRYWASRNLDNPVIETFFMCEEEKQILLNSLDNVIYQKSTYCEDVNQTVTYIEIKI